MLPEIHYMIRTSRILILLGEGILLGICLNTLTNIPCPFKILTKIPCPLCGMTRAFYSFLNLDLKNTFYYNILFIPLLISLLIINILLIAELLLNKPIIIKYFQQLNPKIIFLSCLILLIFSTLINFYHGI